MSDRTTNKYELRRGNKVVYVGITTDMAQREQQHLASGKDFTSMVKVGNITTPEAASRWESERIQTYKVHHGGARPEYNLNDSGK